MHEGNNMGIMTTLKKPTLERSRAPRHRCVVGGSGEGLWWGGQAQPGASSRAQQGRAGDCLQPPLVPRCGFRQRLTPSVRRQATIKHWRCGTWGNRTDCYCGSYAAHLTPISPLTDSVICSNAWALRSASVVVITFSPRKVSKTSSTCNPKVGTPNPIRSNKCAVSSSRTTSEDPLMSPDACYEIILYWSPEDQAIIAEVP